LKYLFNSKNTKNNYAHGEINLQNLNKLLAYENINISGNLHAEISRKKSNIIASDSILFVTKNKDTVLNINKSFLSFGAGISEWNFNLNNSGKEIFSNKGKITRFENKLSKTPELNLNFSISELIFEDKSLPKSIQLPKQSNEITNLPEFGIYYPQKFIYSISLKINKLNISNTQIKDLQLVSTLSDKEIDTQFKYNNNENNFQDLNISIKKLKNETNKIQIKNHSKFLFSDTVNYANIDNTTNLSFLLSDSLQITNNSINGSINFSTTGINIDNELIFSTFPLAKNLIDADIFKVSDSKIDIKIKDSNFEISPFDIKFYKLFMHGFGNFNPHDSVVDLQAFIILNPSHLNMIERKFLKSKALEQNFNLDSLKKGEILNLILKINGSIDKPDVKLIFKNHS
ncbi:MAG: hypothetical protein GX879_11630, partial [Bacteroidales bacterium]|nr:hypothetical protein [Bacteroidales bacterium]